MSPFELPAPDQLLELPPLLLELRPVLTSLDQPLYLVGGLVRDIVLGLGGNDLDLTVASKGIRSAFKIGNALEKPAYILDKERDVGRVVLEETTIDIARFRGDSLEDDLLDRDFTINAIALPLSGERLADLVDPANGLADLADGIIRQASSHAIVSDPIRALRAIRFALKFNYTIEPSTWHSVCRAVDGLADCSPERRRDELVKLFLLARPGDGVTMLSRAGLSAAFLPQLASETPTLLNNLAAIEQGLRIVESGDGRLLELNEVLADVRPKLVDYWNRPVDGGHNGQLLLRLAALLSGESGLKAATSFLDQYRFSNAAQRHVGLVLRQLERLRQLLGAGQLTRRHAYRYFKGVGPAGLDIAILTLAEAFNQKPENWSELVQLTATLFDQFFNHHETVIKPKPMIRGDELIRELALAAGPEIGRLLGIIEEAQAAGTLHTKEEALTLARAS